MEKCPHGKLEWCSGCDKDQIGNLKSQLAQQTELLQRAAEIIQFIETWGAVSPDIKFKAHFLMPDLEEWK